MVSVLSRAQDGMLAKWWWSVDRWGLAGIIFLMVLGLIMGLAASPSIAQQKGLPEYFFFQRQLIFAFLGLFVMLVCSLLSPVGVRRLGYALLGIFGLALILTLLTGSEIKGARRWLNLGFLSLQPSEFIKPALIIISADLMSRTQKVWGRVDPTLV
ncbi:MAG: FtsW/RodA/SpoVE family cell cycle protein, partial [Alphaproteobacteria bacterium]